MRSKPISWVALAGGRIDAFRGTLFLGYALPALTPGQYIVAPIGVHALLAGNLETALRILETNRS